MLQPSSILTLTTDLLANGAFCHLKDEQVTSLHHVILRLREPAENVQQKLLLNFWIYADGCNVPSALLHRCNNILLQMGYKPIEMMLGEPEFSSL